jgi:hypothetical protein
MYYVRVVFLGIRFYLSLDKSTVLVGAVMEPCRSFWKQRVVYLQSKGCFSFQEHCPHLIRFEILEVSWNAGTSAVHNCTTLRVQFICTQPDTVFRDPVQSIMMVCDDCFQGMMTWELVDGMTLQGLVGGNRIHIFGLLAATRQEPTPLTELQYSLCYTE